MRHILTTLACITGGALVYGACVFPEITYLSDDEASGGAGGAPTTGGGIGGVGGDPTTASGGGGSGGMTLECSVANLGITGLCPGNEKCTVIDPATGEVGCALKGPKAIWTTCSDDSDCGDGHWCDLQLNVCKPFCRNAADCAAFGGECLRAPQSGEPVVDIPNNVKTCISMCSPLTALPCPLTMSVTCAFIGNNQFDCAQSGNQAITSGCGTQADCAPTLGCIGGSCEQWCSPIGSGHANCFFSCTDLSQQIFYMGMPIGSCI